MKITKKYLQGLIEEEVQKVLLKEQLSRRKSDLNDLYKRIRRLQKQVPWTDDVNHTWGTDLTTALMSIHTMLDHDLKKSKEAP